jgi:hypothetical protein
MTVGRTVVETSKPPETQARTAGLCVEGAETREEATSEPKSLPIVLTPS